MTRGTGNRPLSDADRLILDAGMRGRQLSADEIERVMIHVAQVGFPPSATYLVGGRLEGLVWEGRRLVRSDSMTRAEAHYLRHVVVREEWPTGTTLAQYLESVRAVVLDPASGLLVNRWHDRVWHLSVVRRSGPLRGPGGQEWLAVEYDVAAGYWATAFQLERGLPSFAGDPRRKELLWLRLPT